jgi:hypothetical protein
MTARSPKTQQIRAQRLQREQGRKSRTRYVARQRGDA